MCKILVIAPYVGLKDLVLEVNEDLQKDLDVYVGNLYDGLAIAKSVEHRQYDVIISRGATAKLLQKHFSIPVMEVQLTGYDILRTLTLLKGHSGKVGMMSYLNTIKGADMIGKLLDMDITFYQIHEEKEIEKKIELASKEGIQLIIGDVISTTTAAKFGIQGILISSGKEAILETIANVEKMVYYMQKQKKNLNKIHQVFDHVEEGVFIFDQNQNCTFINEKAKAHFSFIEEVEMFTFVKLLDIVPKLEDLLMDVEREVLVRMQGKNFLWNMIPLLEGEQQCGTALLMKKQEDQKNELRREFRAYFHFNSLVARSDNMKTLFQVAEKVSRSQLPVIIYGEPGVGKDSLAQAIHNKSERHNEPYVFVNCEAYSETQLEHEFFGSDGDKGKAGVLEIASGGTLFIDAIGTMPLSLQGKLLHVKTSNYMSRLNGTEKFPVNIRFIVGQREPLERYVQDSRFREDLYYALNGFTLKVPPLRERMDDLDDLIRLFTATVNTDTGKQISGLRQEVIDELKEMSWPGNINQLKHVVEQMCLMSDGPFIEKKEVLSLLHKVKEDEKEEDQEVNLLQLQNKTLEEIEQEVILAVLKQEDFNQSNAAKRLGINRSTLWRKIKKLT